jgi:protein tyrosine phosphatase
MPALQESYAGMGMPAAKRSVASLHPHHTVLTASAAAAAAGAVTWLERALRQKGSKVLVHCNAGQGRCYFVIVVCC